MNEKENTFRALKDDVPLVSSFWCKLSIHNWSKYSEPAVRKEGAYEILYQLRGCPNCGLVDLKVIRKY